MPPLKSPLGYLFTSPLTLQTPSKTAPHLGHRIIRTTVPGIPVDAAITLDVLETIVLLTVELLAVELPTVELVLLLPPTLTTLTSTSGPVT